MSALYFLEHPADPGLFSERLRRTQASFAHQGFTREHSIERPDGRLGWYPSPGQPSADDAWISGDGAEAACVGSLFFEGRSGRAALARLLSRFEGLETIRSPALQGNFAVYLRKHGKAWLFNDALGLVKLYQAAGSGLYSTAWLACAETAPALQLDRIGAVDYVMAGANHGARTPVAQVRIVDPACATALPEGKAWPVHAPDTWHAQAPFSHADDAVTQIGELLTAQAHMIASQYPGRIRAALSGGFDSRLLLAALQSAGATPALHVYGGSQDDDVQIARSITAGLGLPLKHIDKTAVNAGLAPLDEAQWRRNLYFFDGLPTDGIFDRGADALTRIAQSSDNHIALNGGGGEILRNFFYLGDRTFSTADIVQVFYRNYPRAALIAPGLGQRYRDYLIDAMEQQIGQRGRLPRAAIELLYPLFRARFWTSRNNSLAARCGPFLTPLLDPALVRAAAQLPLAWKHYGRFEARLLSALSPTLSRYRLAYGFTPAQGPSRRYQSAMWMQHQRPPWLRAATADLKALSARVWQHGAPPGIVPGIAPDSPLRELINPQALIDEGQIVRAASLDCVIRTLNINARSNARD